MKGILCVALIGLVLVAGSVGIQSQDTPYDCEMKAMAFNQYQTVDTDRPMVVQPGSLDLIPLPADICGI